MTVSHLTRRSALIMVGAAIAAVGIAPVAFAAKLNLNNNGIAIQGYDPVAYFTADAPVEGDAAITAEYEGATYQFSSAENRDLFVANPAKYAPAYGGYCAYAVSQGALAPIDPAAYSVVDDKLYLNFSKGVRERWNKDIPGHIAKADSNWPTLSQ